MIMVKESARKSQCAAGTPAAMDQSNPKPHSVPVEQTAFLLSYLLLLSFLRLTSSISYCTRTARRARVVKTYKQR